MKFFTMFLRNIAVCFLLSSFVYGIYDFPVGTVIRDQEVEDVIFDITTPIYNAAGIDHKKVRLFVLIDPVLNAATGMGHTLFLNTGFIFQATVVEFAGVVAHETGHMRGRHVEMGQMVIRDKQKLAVAGMLLGAGTMIASPEAGMAVLMSGPEMARRSFLQYSRGKEASADQAAIEILRKLNWPIRGLSSFLVKLHKREAVSIDKPDPYVLTHPVSSERIDTINAQDKEKKGETQFPENLAKKYLYIQAKLKAFCNPAGVTQKEFGPTRHKDPVAQYAWVISLHKLSKNKEALEELNNLIQKSPDNPYFYELKGQILFLMGKRQEALPCYAKALALKPKADLIRMSYIAALLDSSQQSAVSMAHTELKKLRPIEKETAEYWRLLSIAYGKEKKIGQMAWALAEKAQIVGDTKMARQQVERALKSLKPGQVGYQEVIDLKNELSNEDKIKRNE